MKSIVEFLVKGNIKHENKPYKVYKYKYGEKYYAKINSKDEFNELTSNDAFSEKKLSELKDMIDSLGYEFFKNGLLIRPAIMTNGTKGVWVSTIFSEYELKKYIYVTDITADQFSIKGWQKLGYSIEV